MTDIALTVTQSLPDFVERFVRAFGLATINWGRMEQLLELLLRIADDPTYNTSETGTLPNHLVSAPRNMCTFGSPSTTNMVAPLETAKFPVVSFD